MIRFAFKGPLILWVLPTSRFAHNSAALFLPSFPPRKKRMCILCEPNRREEVQRATHLNCSYCPNVAVIPFLPNLTHLRCSMCPNLTTIPALPSLKKLHCFDCPLLVSIPVLPNLLTLMCDECPLLKTIPMLPALRGLDCSECPLLGTLPALPNLISLMCYDCPLLTALPLLPKLTRLICDPWIDHPLNTYFVSFRDAARSIERIRRTNQLHRRFNIFRTRPQYSAYLNSPGHIGHRLAMGQFRAFQGVVEAAAAAAAQPAAAAAADPAANAELERRQGVRRRMEQDHTEQGKDKQQKRA